jgi:hypothetical protein
MPTPAPRNTLPENVSLLAHAPRVLGALASLSILASAPVLAQAGSDGEWTMPAKEPPAYGIWRKVGGREYEAKYEFYVTKAPANFEEIAKGGGWGLAGRGVFVEKITLSEDGKSFTSKIKYDQFDTAGKPSEGGGEATGQGVKLAF